MPPKKKATAQPKTTDDNNVKAQQPAKGDQGDLKSSAAESDDTNMKKRKHTTEAKQQQPAKVPREATRQSARSRDSNANIEPQQLLNYLLSDHATELLRPDDEKKHLEQHPNAHTYSSLNLNAFQELMSAMILSRPISHMLGLRTIRTVLNDPYSWNTPSAIHDTGDDERLKAFYDARTQHKDKTAAQVDGLARTILDNYVSDVDKDGTSLKKVLNDHDDNPHEALSVLKKEINGLGDTGIEIFKRRVQWLHEWKKVYPFVDGKSQDALRELGILRGHDDLKELVDKHWDQLQTDHLTGGDEEIKKRRAFVVILERATGAILENKVGEVRAAAASDSSS